MPHTRGVPFSLPAPYPKLRQRVCVLGMRPANTTVQNTKGLLVRVRGLLQPLLVLVHFLVHPVRS